MIYSAPSEARVCALADLQHYLHAAPGVKDAETVREQVLRLQKLIEGMH